MGIPHKKGKCIDCEPGSELKFLIAGRCITKPYHYTDFQKNKYLLKKKERDRIASQIIADTNEGQTLGNWFKDQVDILPLKCENCFTYLNPNAEWGAVSYIAHILPKRFFKSVCVHPQNRLFLCIDCHTMFDKSLSIEIEKMPCFPVAVKRFTSFMAKIEKDEIIHLQDCFRKIVS